MDLSNTNTHLVSIVMAVYNGEEFLAEAIDSMLKQTYKDFEFIIIDDGSIDESVKIIKSFGDPRIILLQNGENLNLATSLNRGIKYARGKYIARMDADDISLPKRLQRQVEYLEKHPEVGLVGVSRKLLIEGKLKKIYNVHSHEEIAIRLLFECPIIHSGVLFKKELFIANNLLYNASFYRVQDYELWGRAIRHIKFAVLPKVLLYYRVKAKKFIDSIEIMERKKYMYHISKKQLIYTLGCNNINNTYLPLYIIENGVFLSKDKILRPKEIYIFFNKILLAKKYSPIRLRLYLGYKWLGLFVRTNNVQLLFYRYFYWGVIEFIRNKFISIFY
ncbi:putative glycosyltransferase EpsE [termite gut metagenome]|uniref:Putative glycosyltransferase EpsE n=1 Tax=termite gut metagenome TaxID=433724 RepID=A0A5J4S250_9ZZZZ